LDDLVKVETDSVLKEFLGSDVQFVEMEPGKDGMQS
jgi:hypothetical protein